MEYTYVISASMLAGLELVAAYLNSKTSLCDEFTEDIRKKVQNDCGDAALLLDKIKPKDDADAKPNRVTLAEHKRIKGLIQQPYPQRILLRRGYGFSVFAPCSRPWRSRSSWIAFLSIFYRVHYIVRNIFPMIYTLLEMLIWQDKGSNA